ncbi:MAG: hypothetical protein ACE5G1_18080, partial [bacterium]
PIKAFRAKQNVVSLTRFSCLISLIGSKMGSDKTSFLENLVFSIAIVLLSGVAYLLVENNGIEAEKLADSVPFIHGLVKKLLDFLITSIFN